MSRYLVFSNSSEYTRVMAQNIVYIVSAGNYSDIYTCDNKKYTVLAQLGCIEKMITHQLDKKDQFLMRIGKCLIVNLLYVCYINPNRAHIILSDNRTFLFDNMNVESIKVSQEALKVLKEHFDNQKNNK
ncbi:MAG: LytTR family transcriptional regulator [Bacteroidales bacterium]|nr:LytTR family transcriptional regulator [Bacteroidales bacterium]